MIHCRKRQIVDKANVPRVGLKLVKDRDLGLVPIETLQIVDDCIEGEST